MEPAASTTTTSSVDYSKMKLPELKKELQAQGLDTSGKKSELIARLEGKAAGGGGKTGGQTKQEDDDEEVTPMEETDFSKAVRALTDSAGKKKGPRQRKVDSHYGFSAGMEVFEDWDCMLNQTNIGHNNNKYYVIQLLTNTGM